REQAAADQPAQRAPDGAVAELAERAGGDPFAEADRQAQHHPAEAASERGHQEAASGELFQKDEIDVVAQPQAEGAAEGPDDHTVRRQTAEADQRLIAEGLDADDPVANAAADQAAADQPLAEVFGAGIAEDAEEHPAQQAAQTAEDCIEVDA